MSDDIFADILAELKKGNDANAAILESLNETKKVEAKKVAKPEPKKTDRNSNLVEKLFDVANRYGGKNRFTDAARVVASKTSQRFVKGIGADGASLTDYLGTAKSTNAAPAQNRIPQIIANAQQAAAPRKQPVVKVVNQNLPVAKPVASPGATVTNTAGAAAKPAAQAAAGTGIVASIRAAVAGLGTFGTVLGTVGLVLAGLTAGVAIVVGVFAALTAAITKITDAFIESQRAISKYNANLAVAFANAKVRDIQRNIKIANATGGGTANLISAQQDLKDALVPMRIALTNLTTAVLTPMVRILTAILNFLKPLFDAINWLAEVINAWVGVQKKPQASILPGEAMMEQFRQGKLPRDAWGKKRDRLPPIH